MSIGAEIGTVDAYEKLLYHVDNLYNLSKFYCYKGLNNTHCFEYNRIIENRCFRGEDYIFSLEAKFFWNPR